MKNVSFPVRIPDCLKLLTSTHFSFLMRVFFPKFKKLKVKSTDTDPLTTQHAAYATDVVGSPGVPVSARWPFSH